MYLDSIFVKVPISFFFSTSFFSFILYEIADVQCSVCNNLSKILEVISNIVMKYYSFLDKSEIVIITVGTRYSCTWSW